MILALNFPTGFPIPGKRGTTVLTILEEQKCMDNDRLEGGSDNDMLLGDYGYITGSALANVVARGGGEGEGIYDDTYVFNAGVALGSDTVVETKNGGSDTLTFASTVSQVVKVWTSSISPS